MEYLSYAAERIVATLPVALPAYATFWLFLAFGSVYLPGKVHQGVQLGTSKKRLNYKCNGFLLLVTSVAAFFVGSVVLGLFPVTIVYDNIAGFLFTVQVWTLVHTVHLYLRGRDSKEASELGIPDREKDLDIFRTLWFGVEVNPRLSEKFDWKFFAYRPAMIFWLIVNFSIAGAQYRDAGHLTWNMMVYQFTTGWYVVDYFWHEPKMLSTWDIVTERFGFMLVWGDYFFIPFYFSIGAWVLAPQTESSSGLYILINMAIFTVGYWIFRTSNSQKHYFKEAVFQGKPYSIWGKPAETMPTERGTPLLISGFWGIARKCNYLGDLLMALAYCLPCTTHYIGYAYFVYLLLCLTHRAHRDNIECSRKYGADWKRYCERVPWTICPYLY